MASMGIGTLLQNRQMKLAWGATNRWFCRPFNLKVADPGGMISYLVALKGVQSDVIHSPIDKSHFLKMLG